MFRGFFYTRKFCDQRMEAVDVVRTGGVDVVEQGGCVYGHRL
jgi:hypothetical protein